MMTAAAVIIAATLTACVHTPGRGTDHAGPPSSAVDTGQAYLLPQPPAGFQMAGAAEFPGDEHAPTAPYALTLYSAESASTTQGARAGDDLAVFTRSAAMPSAASSRGELPQLGPAGLAGYHAVNAKVDRIFVSRHMPVNILARLASLPESALEAELSTYRTSAHQTAASVPGNGSLPMPITHPGFATSYIADASHSQGDLQRSIAIGSYHGATADVAVLDWWYGSGSTTQSGVREYTFPAFASADNGPVPDAHLYAAIRNGDLLLVRFVGVARTDELEILTEVAPVSSASWRTSTERYRLGGRPTATIAQSHGRTSWTMTLSQQPGIITLCLLVPELHNTACIAGAQPLPAGEQIGLVGSVAGAKPFVFGVIGPAINSVTVHQPGGDVPAEITDTASGGRVFVVQATPMNGEVQVTVQGGGINLTRPLTVSG